MTQQRRLPASPRKCCQQYPSARTIQAAQNVLRTTLNHAMTEELIARNPAALTRVRGPRKIGLTWTAVRQSPRLPARRADSQG